MGFRRYHCVLCGCIPPLRKTSRHQKEAPDKKIPQEEQARDYFPEQDFSYGHVDNEALRQYYEELWQQQQQTYPPQHWINLQQDLPLDPEDMKTVYSFRPGKGQDEKVEEVSKEATEEEQGLTMKLDNGNSRRPSKQPVSPWPGRKRADSRAGVLALYAAIAADMARKNSQSESNNSLSSYHDAENMYLEVSEQSGTVYHSDPGTPSSEQQLTTDETLQRVRLELLNRCPNGDEMPGEV